jgi:heme-degrading monooxygenase HmoA
MQYFIFVKGDCVCHGGSSSIDKASRMASSRLIQRSVESYITSRGKMGYYLLALDGQGRWYWGAAYAEQLDPLSTAEFHGPCSSKGEAINAGEVWVEAESSPISAHTHEPTARADVTKERQRTIRMVTAVEVAPGHEDALEDAWRTLREARRQYSGFRGASLLRDSSQATHYLVLSEWDGHDQLAEAMRGLNWLNRDLSTNWMAGPTQVYDEIVDSMDGTGNPM